MLKRHLIKKIIVCETNCHIECNLAGPQSILYRHFRDAFQIMFDISREKMYDIHFFRAPINQRISFTASSYHYVHKFEYIFKY